MLPHEDCPDPGVAVRDYEIIEEVHRGGQGIVYRAMQHTTNRLAAVKILRGGGRATPSQRVRFAREIEVASRLNHPNIVRIFDGGVLDDRCYFAMEFVEGLPIDEYVFLHDSSIEECVRLLVKVCRAVSHAHLNGVIHRDLKPSNILIDVDGEPRLLDFGLAKDLLSGDTLDPARSPSMSGQIVGTLPYLSPEQAAGLARNIDARADIYALGVVLYQMLTREFPYPIEGHPDDVRGHIIRTPPRALSQAIGPASAQSGRPGAASLRELEAVLSRALEKDRDRRYQSAADFADDLERWLRGEPVEARGHDRFYLLRKTLRAYRTHAVIAGLFVVVLLASVIGIGVAWRRAERVAAIARAGLEMGSLFRTATVERDNRRLEQALALLDKAAEIGAATADDDPTLVRLTISTHCELGRLRRADGDMFKARDHLDRAAAAESGLCGDDVSTLRHRAGVWILRGQLALDEGEYPEALHSFERACRLYPPTAGGVELAEEVRFDRAVLLGWTGRCKRQLGLSVEALADLCESLELLESLAAGAPRRADYVIELARAHEKLAVWHIVQGTPSDDLAAHQYLDDEQALLASASREGLLETLQRDAQGLLDAIRANERVLRKRRGATPADAGQDGSMVPSVSTGSSSPSSIGS